MREGVSVPALAARDGCVRKRSIPFNATPRADASNSDSPGQNSLHHVALVTPVLKTLNNATIAARGSIFGVV